MIRSIETGTTVDRSLLQTSPRMQNTSVSSPQRIGRIHWIQRCGELDDLIGKSRWASLASKPEKSESLASDQSAV